ncbi:putative ribonuclease H-like domain-containing protein [Tanacetum coccineum]|uniref:Ribonuclease H-like domain-containing protein n=1 Tax=Tanacetum coccineum TaxID=301880 RepID=A0ABQ5IU64_9ASTR
MLPFRCDQISGVLQKPCQRFSWTFFLRSKDETSAILKDFIRQIENQLNQKVKTIRCDNGTEFKNRDINEFCGLKGIKREYSNARTPQQNGVAERKNRTLIEAARTMLADSFLPNTFWAEAVSTACYVLNRVLVTKPHNKTPYELLTGKTPIISYIRPFGCHVTILNTIEHLGKFAGKSDEGFLVGYSLQSKAFRVYNLVTKRVEENLHIKFLENKPNVAGKGPNWLFDLDYLTDSMNYLSVSSENQANIHAGQQETNQNEGSKDKIDSGNSQIEDESAQDCFEVPYWHSIPVDATDGIFTHASYDDEGAVADFTNLETIVNVSPIPTSRVHPSHPSTLILGDPTSAVQTRSKSVLVQRIYFDLGITQTVIMLEQILTGNPQQEVVNFLAEDSLHGNAKKQTIVATSTTEAEYPVPTSGPVHIKSKEDCSRYSYCEAFEDMRLCRPSTEYFQEKWVICVDVWTNLVPDHVKLVPQDKSLYRLKRLENNTGSGIKVQIVNVFFEISPNFSYQRSTLFRSNKAALESCPKEHNIIAYLEKTEGNVRLRSQSSKGKLILSSNTSSISEENNKRNKDIKGTSSQRKKKGAIKICIQTREKNAKEMVNPKENAQSKGRTKEMMDEDKETDELGLSTEDEVSTAKKGVSTEFERVSTDRPKLSTDDLKVSTEEQSKEEIASQASQTSSLTPTSVIFGDDETIATLLINMSKAKAISKEKEKGVELKDVEDTDRPKTTSTRSTLTLKPLPKIDPKDKGKKKIEEEDETESEDDDIPQVVKKFKQLENDEELARKVQEEWEAEEEKNKIAEEEAANEALIKNFDDVKARIEADRILAEKLQEQRNRAVYNRRKS